MHTHTLTHTHTHMHAHTYTHAYARTHTHTHAHTHAHAHTCTRARTHAHTRTHTHKHSSREGSDTQTFSECALTFTPLFTLNLVSSSPSVPLQYLFTKHLPPPISLHHTPLHLYLCLHAYTYTPYTSTPIRPYTHTPIHPCTVSVHQAP